MSTVGELDAIFAIDSIPDTDIIAKRIVDYKGKKGKKVPEGVDLAKAITSIDLTDSYKGSSTIAVQFADPDWDLLDSNFFDANRDGKIDPIDLNYPDGSRFWWRATQLAISGSSRTVTVTFMERAAAHLMAHNKPVKFSRAKKTRAQAIKSVVDTVKVRKIRFVSKELNVKQEIDRTQKEKDERSDTRANKDQGIHSSETISYKDHQGTTITLKSGELSNASEACAAIKKTDPPEKAALACLAACIVEGPHFRNPTGGDGTSSGILQLTNDKLGGSTSTSGGRRDIAKVVTMFMEDGFTGRGGAIALAKAHKDWTIGQIAQGVQGSAYPDRYDKVKDGAEKVWEAFGEGGLSGGTQYKQYNFQVGGPDNPRENYWDAINRWADEVKWALFLDGQDLYYDSELTLIKQKPVAVIKRDASYVVNWDGNWDGRQIATEMTIDLIVDFMEFRAGEVFKLEGFGPLSTGSTAKLPGRWLISEISHSRFSAVASFTLKQPEAPAPEPSPEEQSTNGGSGDGDSGELVDICKQFDGKYKWGGGHGALSSVTVHSDLDCSGSVSKALKLAGMFPGSNGIVSGEFARWGKPGRGAEFTVWSNGGHVFIQSEGGGTDWRFDTGGPGGGEGPRYREQHRPTAGFTPTHWKGS